MNIIEGRTEWAEKYHQFCQPIYVHAYTAPELDIPAEAFSAEAFKNNGADGYFADMFTNDKTWLALDDNNEIIGGIAASDTDPVHMSGFYVAVDKQGRGVGSQLFKKVLEFAAERDIELDVMKHATKSIDMYKHLGFKVKEGAQPVYYHWAYSSERGRENGAGVTMIRKGKGRQ